MEEDSLPEEEEVMEGEEEEEVEEEAEEEATHPRDPQETQSPPDLTSLLTYDPSPAPRMRDQWENSPMSLTAIEPKQKRLSTNLTTISYSTSTSRGSTPQLKRSPWLLRLSKGPRSLDGRGR